MREQGPFGKVAGGDDLSGSLLRAGRGCVLGLRLKKRGCVLGLRLKKRGCVLGLGLKKATAKAVAFLVGVVFTGWCRAGCDWSGSVGKVPGRV